MVSLAQKDRLLREIPFEKVKLFDIDDKKEKVDKISLGCVN